MFYFSTNKPPIFFFWQNTSWIRKPQVILRGEGVREPLHPPPRSAPEVYMYTLLHCHYQHPSASAETPQTTPFHIDLFCISHHNRDLKWRPRTGFKFDFLRVFSKNPTPEGFIVLFSPEKLAQLFLLKKVLKFSHERLDTNLFPFPLKLVVEWWRLSRFPAKMTLAHARALLKNLVLEVFLFLESKAKVSIIQVPNHSPSLGSSSIYTTATEVQTPHKKRIRDASNLLAFIPSRCPILANFSVVEFFLQLTVSKFRKRKIKSMFTLVR